MGEKEENVRGQKRREERDPVPYSLGKKIPREGKNKVILPKSN